MKSFKKTVIALLLVISVLALCACAAGETKQNEEPTPEPAPAVDPTPEPTPEPEDPNAGKVCKVTYVDGDGTTVLLETEIAYGTILTEPDNLVKEGYIIEGFYATPALKYPFEFGSKLTRDTRIFVAWKSGIEDNRPWMLAGSLRGYPENAWGKIRPQDDFLLHKVDGEFNVFDITVNLYEGDAFKIAVIGEGYAWDDTASIDAGHLADKSEGALLKSGENVFDSGANIQVAQDGKYRLILTTDAETLSLCSLSYERLGDADEVAEVVYDMKLWASFNEWAGQDMSRNGDDFIWYCVADVPAEGGEFGVRNAATEDWYSSENNTKNIEIEEGTYLFRIELELSGGKAVLKGDITAETPAYYVVGTCGAGGWGADANAENTDYMLQDNGDGTYSTTLTFTDAETAEWAGGKVAFKVVYGAGGWVPNEYWFGADGENITVDPGTYTITFNPETGIVTVE